MTECYACRDAVVGAELSPEADGRGELWFALCDPCAEALGCGERRRPDWLPL